MFRLTLGKKIGGGFGLVIVITAFVALWAILGIEGIIDNAKNVIYGNYLRGEVAQREVDHLNWAITVNQLLNDDDVTTLKVQTDPHKCGFGKWYYGKGRQEAERRVPALKELFVKIEQPHKDLHASAIEIGGIFHQADEDLPAFLAEKENDHLKWINACQNLFVNNEKALRIETDDHKCGLGRFIYGPAGEKAAASDPEMARLIENLRKPHNQLHQSAIKIRDTWHQCHEGLYDILRSRLDDHRRWVAKVSEAMLLGKKKIDVQMDPTKCAFGKFLASDKAERYMSDFPELKTALAACGKPHQELHTSAIEIEAALKAGDINKANNVYMQKTLPSLAKITAHFGNALEAEEKLTKSQSQAKETFRNETLPALANTQNALRKLRQRATDLVHGMNEAKVIYANKTVPALSQVKELLRQISSTTKENVMTDEQMLKTARDTNTGVTALSILAVILGIAISVIISLMITRPISRIVSALAQVSEGNLTVKADVKSGDEIGQMANALNTTIEKLARIVSEIRTASIQTASSGEELSASAQNISSGSQSQAASVEEVGASMEELTASINQVADNARAADSVAAQTTKSAESGAETVGKSINGMNLINESSTQINKIIEVISQIANQTNLLALNAAIEAASAGEHGLGFAVVADEVRKLAERSGQAAEEITELIEESSKRVAEGSRLSEEVGTALKGILDGIEETAASMDQISRGTSEQSTTADGVAKALEAISAITEENSASAEEMAASAEELSAQAQRLQELVDQFKLKPDTDMPGNLVRESSQTTGEWERTAALQHVS